MSPAIATSFVFAFTLLYGDLVLSIIIHILGPEIYTVPIVIQYLLNLPIKRRNN